MRGDEAGGGYGGEAGMRGDGWRRGGEGRGEEVGGRGGGERGGEREGERRGGGGVEGGRGGGGGDRERSKTKEVRGLASRPLCLFVNGERAEGMFQVLLQEKATSKHSSGIWRIREHVCLCQCVLRVCVCVFECVRVSVCEC